MFRFFGNMRLQFKKEKCGLSGLSRSGLDFFPKKGQNARTATRVRGKRVFFPTGPVRPPFFL